jgi:protein-S-isoprenylcysteine O-methyltransferase Ste14
MTHVALLLYVAGLTVTFGLRTLLHLRRTGSSGFHGISGRPGSLRWWAGISFAGAVVLGLASLVLAAVGVLPPGRGPLAAGMAVGGLVVAVAGLVAVLVAQSDMGSSWRIGVEESERTELVSGGLFGLVRNPVFSGMIAAQAGITAMVPTWLSLAALAWLVAAVELQVRLIEEPYLLAVHGVAYRRYAGEVGRFVPLVGRWGSAREVPGPWARS